MKRINDGSEIVPVALVTSRVLKDANIMNCVWKDTNLLVRLMIEGRAKRRSDERRGNQSPCSLSPQPPESRRPR